MARNDVYLNINALSPADAVVTGQQDMTAATVPELVLGDTPTFNFYFTDNTNVWPSWAGNAAYTVTWALSDAVSGDFSPAATTGNATPITGGWSVILPLNAYDLVGLLNTKRVSQPYPVTNLWQQIRVADPSGNEVTRAMFWTPVRYRAISDTQNTESASPTGGREVTVDNVNVLTTPTAAQFYAANPVPTSALGSAANGELLIGNGTGFTKATLTAGDGVTITNASGSITIDASAAQEKLTATVKNAESTPITKGQVVYLFGATGNVASVKLAYNTSDATSAKTFGVVSSASIAANGTGLVTCVGVVDGLNLGAYQDGDTLYLGATPGSVTATKPYAPNHLVYVGIVERANNGNGELYVRVQNGYELDEIHDVQINSPRQSGQTLIYDNTTSLWKNARITAGNNIAVTNGDGSISIGFSGTLPVANGGTGVTTSTGSGSVVLSTSPTLTTPILGTPQSGTLSSCTGLPISTGVSGLGTNVATFLATPSSANLASAVTDETGTGALVFANTPTLVTPNIGAATGTSVNLSGSGTLGTTLTVNGTTDSSSKDTGTIVTEGGLGVEKSATIGGNLTVSGLTTSAGVSNSGALTFTAAAGQIAGSIAKNATYGLTYYGVTGSSNDNTMLNASGAVVLSNPAGTTNATLAGNLTVSGNSTLGSGNTYPIYGYSGYFQFAGLTAGKFAAAGTYRAHAGVGSDTFSIQLYNGSAWSEVANFGSTSTNIGGNLTVSGTGTSTFGGTIRAGAGSGETLGAGSVDVAADLGIKSTQGIVQGGARIVAFTNGNTLLGTGTDSGNGKLQLATHTTSAGGIGFGTDTSLYRQAAGALSIDHIGGSVPVLNLSENGTIKAILQTSSGNVYLGAINTAGASLFLRSGNNTTALTLDSSQRVITASTLNVGSGTNDAQFINVFTNKLQNTSGPVTINLPADSSGVVTLYSSQGGIGKSMWQIPYINDGGTVQLGTAVKTIKTADPVSSAVAATGAITVSVVAANTYCFWGINCVKP